ncbi:hypothetical protein HanIR_Chr10g0457821 [Helianthus annuus]|nr:hypothetical protein HanIR_Chr10g0457821 [Helianthus annuus]
MWIYYFSRILVISKSHECSFNSRHVMISISYVIVGVGNGLRNYLLSVRMRGLIVFSKGAVRFFCLKNTLIFFPNGTLTHPQRHLGPPLLRRMETKKVRRY